MTRTFAGQFVATCYAIFFVYWVGAAFWAKRTIERSGWWGSWPTRAAAAIVVAAFIVMRDRTGRMPAGIHLWSYTPTVGVIASVVTVMGLAISLWGRTSLG